MGARGAGGPPGRGDAPELLATDVLAREKPPRDARVALAEGVHEGAERSKGEAPRKTERNNGLAIARATAARQKGDLIRSEMTDLI